MRLRLHTDIVFGDMRGNSAMFEQLLRRDAEVRERRKCHVARFQFISSFAVLNRHATVETSVSSVVYAGTVPRI